MIDDNIVAPLQVGLVGLRFGRHLLRALSGLAGVEVSHVADRNADATTLAEMAADRRITLHADAVGMIRSCKLDAVVVATSPKSRAPVLAACAELGLPLFVEKPWAGNLTQAREFERLCGPIGSRTMVGFSFRRHPVVKELRSLLERNLGQVWMANGEYAFHWDLGPGGWIWDADAGGGLVNENSCHLIDVLRHLIGEPVCVHAFTANPRGRPSAELAAVNFQFASGAVASVTFGGLGARAFNGYPRLDVVAERGRASLLGRGHVWTTLRWAQAEGLTVHEMESDPEYLGRTRYTDALEEFVGNVRRGHPMEIGIRDGVRAVEIAAAILRSAATGEAQSCRPS